MNVRICAWFMLAAACRTAPADTGETGQPPTETAPVGNDVDLDTFPPVVVQTVPTSGSVDVSASLTRMTVTFSRPMRDDSWAWVERGGTVPEIATAYFETDTRHVADGVVVEAGQAYAAWLNDPFGYYANFMDVAKLPAVAYPLTFYTGDAGTDPSVLAAAPGAVVETDPVAGTDGVDPALAEIVVRFGKDVDPGSLSLVDDKPRTALPIVESGFDDPRTLRLDVALEPGATYALWVGTWEYPCYDVYGQPLAPYLLSFRTAE